MILVRTRAPSRQAADWATELARMSRLPALLLTDGRNLSSDSGSFDVADTLRMTRAADRDLGLYSPPDVSWRCGDYGFYAARRMFPDVSHFWMIEDDVRISGDGTSFFSHFFGFPGVDFLAANLSPADRDWWWHSHALARDTVPQKGFFPVVRLSAHAIDRLHRVRQRHSKSWLRRSLWPNDEVFVATTIGASGLSFADLNGLGRSFYDADTFGYNRVIDPAEVSSLARTMLCHPVLTVEDQERRRARLDAAAKDRRGDRRLRTAILKRLNSWTRW